jgi:hypothetical protein
LDLDQKIVTKLSVLFSIPTWIRNNENKIKDEDKKRSSILGINSRDVGVHSGTAIFSHPGYCIDIPEQK